MKVINQKPKKKPSPSGYVVLKPMQKVKISDSNIAITPRLTRKDETAVRSVDRSTEAYHFDRAAGSYVLS